MNVGVMKVYSVSGFFSVRKFHFTSIVEQGDTLFHFISDQQTGVIEDKPVVKIQSASAAPGMPLHHVQLFKFPYLMMRRLDREELLVMYRCCLVMTAQRRGGRRIGK